MKKKEKKIVALVFFAFFISYTVLAQKEVVYNINTGHNLKNQIYLKKGESGCLIVTGYNPITDSVVFKKSEKDIDFSAGNVGDPLKNYKTNIENPTGNVSRDVKAEINAITIDGGGNQKSEMASLKQQKKLLDSAHYKVLQLKIKLEQRRKRLLRRATMVLDASAMVSLISEEEAFLSDVKLDFEGIYERTLDELKETQNSYLEEEFVFEDFLSYLKSLSFETRDCISANKEESMIEVLLYKLGSKTPFKKTSIKFVTLNRFKISNSVGAQAMIIDGLHSRSFDNIDSQIFDRKISNVQPSVTTYLHGTWRRDDALLGLALGVGIPIALTNEEGLTPNFSIVFTSLFQTDLGRFGFNIGCGIREVRILAPGYKVGGFLSDASIKVPTIPTWKPGLVFGISYVIGNKE